MQPRAEELGRFQARTHLEILASVGWQIQTISVRLRAEVERVKEGPHVQRGATQGQLTDRWIWVPAGRVLRRAGRRAVQGRP